MRTCSIADCGAPATLTPVLVFSVRSDLELCEAPLMLGVCERHAKLDVGAFLTEAVWDQLASSLRAAELPACDRGLTKIRYAPDDDPVIAQLRSQS